MNYQSTDLDIWEMSSVARPGYCKPCASRVQAAPGTLALLPEVGLGGGGCVAATKVKAEINHHLLPKTSPRGSCTPSRLQTSK